MAGTAQSYSNDGTPTNGANPWIDALVWGGAWEDTPGLPSDGGDVTITYCLASGTDPHNVLSGSNYSWDATSIAAFNAAIAVWEAVAKIDFVSTTNKNNADSLIWLGDDTSAEGNLGWSEVPGTVSEPLYTVFNADDSSWDANGLAQGGFGFITLIHELGHLLGLAHPHDGGSEADATTFPGVTSPFGDYGTNNLNQGIFTTMSYNDGWATEFPTHSDEGYGWQATAMALDIAAIQKIYGANKSYATGDDTYTLPTANASGTFWSCIWDAGGTDTISNAGATGDCTIDLRMAQLTGANAGGYVSWNDGIVGGFTIANKAFIENAFGGMGDDVLTGNQVKNQIRGEEGNDTITGGLDVDKLYGGADDDRLTDTDGNDWLYGDEGNDFLASGVGKDKLFGGDGDDTIQASTDNDKIDGGAGADTMTGGQGKDQFRFFEDAVNLVGTETDTITDFVRGSDKIDLRGLDADFGTSAVIDTFAFAGTTAANHAVWFEAGVGGVLVSMDVNGDAVADHEVWMQGLTTLSETDFLFS
jgi:serralysin